MSEQRTGSRSETLEMDLRQFFKIMHKSIGLISAITLLVTLATGIINFYMLKPVYQTTTLLMVTVASEKLEIDQPIIQDGAATGLNNRNIMPILTMNTYLGQLKSEALMKRVIDRLNLQDQNVASLSKIIEANIITDSNLIEVKVNHNDPVLAYNIAYALSDEYLALTKEFMFSSVVVISPANMPVKSVKPNKILNISTAFILGLILSVLLAFLKEYLDNTLKTVADVERELNLPVLGLIPAENRYNIKQHGYGGAE